MKRLSYKPRQDVRNTKKTKAIGSRASVVVDNGVEFHSSTVKAAFDALGIRIIYASVHAPLAKARAERLAKSQMAAMARSVTSADDLEIDAASPRDIA